MRESVIDPVGQFKYIQIEVTDKNNPDNKKTLIRGDRTCDFHFEIFDKFKAEEFAETGLSA